MSSLFIQPESCGYAHSDTVCPTIILTICLHRLRDCYLGGPYSWWNYNASPYLHYSASHSLMHLFLVIPSPANPTYTADELKHQLSVTRAKFIAVHSDCWATAKSAARACGIPDSALFLIDSRTPSTGSDIPTIEELMVYGASKAENYKAIRFKQGEARTTIAFLSFSSGTTG